MTMTDERLMAYADNELSDDEMREISALAQADPAIAAKIAHFRAQRAALGDAFAPILQEPTPLHFVAAIRAGARRSSQGGWIRTGAIGMAMAASFAAGFVIAPPSTPSVLVADANGLVAQGVLRDALNTQASGAAVNGVAIAMTTPAKAGGVCRAFLADLGDQSIEAVACAESANEPSSPWRVTAMATRAATDSDSAYRTAAGAVSPAILAALDAQRDGDPFGADQELAWIKARQAR